MAENVMSFANSSIGVGITGQIGNEDINTTYASIKYKNSFFDYIIITKKNTREEKKDEIIKIICKNILKILHK